VKRYPFGKRFAACCIASAFPALATVAAATAGTDQGGPELRVQPAEQLMTATRTQILAATRAGKRIVAVGDFGVVLLSDDDGATFRQARSVRARSTLTSVTFVDDRTGWAVGHWGTILKTVDGGETWALERSDVASDRPLFSVYFRNAREGFAVGLWSLLLHTIDGGNTWTEASLAAPFDLTTAPLAGGPYFLGDYQGLAASGTNFLAFFVATAPGGSPRISNLYSATIPGTHAVRPGPPHRK